MPSKQQFKAQIRSLFLALVLAVAAALQSGCGTLQHRAASDVEIDRVRSLERELRRKQIDLQDLKERNIVLERRLREIAQASAADSSASVPIPFDPSAANARFTPALPQATSRQAAPPEPEIVATAPTGEQRFYAKILDSYRTHKMVEMEKTLEIMLKTYPDSVVADNALYLAGQLAFEQNDLKRASAQMDRLLVRYPEGNKAVSALYAKAMIESRMARRDEARRLLEKLKTRYPGSPEAARAMLEIKLIDTQAGATKRREM